MVWILGAVACVALTAAVYFGVTLSKVAPPAADARAWSPELEAIWSPFLTGDRPVVLSLGTPRFTKFKYGFFRNPRVNTDDEAAQSVELRAIQRLVQSPFAVPAYPYTGTGEAMGAFRLGRFLQGRVPNLALRRSSTLHWDSIRTSNVIFLGAPKFNPQLYDLPVENGFIVHDGAIRNSRPRPGEAEAYRSTWAPNETDLEEDFALVSRFGNLHGAGEILALGGGSTESTWAAVEYVTQPEYARDLVGRVGMTAGHLPDSYQVVIRVRFRQQVPLDIASVTHRVLIKP